MPTRFENIHEMDIDELAKWLAGRYELCESETPCSKCENKNWCECTNADEFKKWLQQDEKETTQHKRGVSPLTAMVLAEQVKNKKRGVVVFREDGKFNFEFMTDSEMCYLLEQLIEEINRRKAGTVDVGFWDKAGNYVEDRQPVQNAVVDLGITVHGGIKTADVTVEVEGKENE